MSLSWNNDYYGGCQRVMLLILTLLDLLVDFLLLKRAFLSLSVFLSSGPSVYMYLILLLLSSSHANQAFALTSPPKLFPAKVTMPSALLNQFSVLIFSIPQQYLTQIINSPHLEMFSWLGSQDTPHWLLILRLLCWFLSLHVGGSVLHPLPFSVYAHSLGDLTQARGVKNHFYNEGSCISILGRPKQDTAHWMA